MKDNLRFVVVANLGRLRRMKRTTTITTKMINTTTTATTTPMIAPMWSVTVEPETFDKPPTNNIYCSVKTDQTTHCHPVKESFKQLRVISHCLNITTIT